MITALSCPEDETTLSELLSLLTEETGLALDAASFAGAVAANPVGKEMVWQWLEEAWMDLWSDEAS